MEPERDIKIRQQAAKLLQELRDNTVNDPFRYAEHEQPPEGTDIYGEFNASRLWDSCEICLSDLMKKLSIPRKIIIECVTLLEQQGLVKMMSQGDWWKVYLNTE